MNTLFKEKFKVLMEQRLGPCISMYLPTHRAGAEMHQDLVRLRHQIRQAENLLLLADLYPAEAEDLLKPIQALVDDEQFWLHPGDGLAIFRSPNVFVSSHLPYSLKEQVSVSNHFALKPLLPFLSDDGHFYMLALSQNAVRLFAGTHYSVHEIELPEAVPQSLAEALKYDRSANEVQYHSSSSGASVGKGGKQAVVFHGQGVGTDDNKEHILRYFQQINRGLHELLKDERAPLVLAGVEYLFPLYHEANTYPHLLNQGVTGNPDKLKAETLQQQAWTVVEPYFLQAQQDAAAQYRNYAGTERASNNISEVVPAAYYGRVNSLFVATDREQWGSFDPATYTMHVHQEARFRDEDLLDVAATQTLLHGGSVYAVEQANMPDNVLVAAVFRY